MKRSLVVAFCAVLFLASVPVMASTFVHMSPRELVAEADALIQGRVVALDSFWSESGRIIVSEAVIEVEETLFGKAPATVTVRTFGGQVGDVRVEAHGFPKFEKGERAILFLEKVAADGSIRVLGYQQGQFRVVTRRDGVTLAVPMVDADARLLTRDGRPGPEPRSLEIGFFKKQISRLATDLGRIER